MINIAAATGIIRNDALTFTNTIASATISERSDLIKGLDHFPHSERWKRINVTAPFIERLCCIKSEAPWGRHLWTELV